MFRASTSTGILGARVCSYAVPIATATGGLNSLPVESAVYSCTCGDIHCAGTSIARCTLPLVEYMRRHHQCPCTCACHGVHRAGIRSVCAAPAQALEYFAPAPVAYYALLRLQQVVSILSLSCPPSTLSRVVEYIAPAPAVLLHLRLSWCRSRWHKQCLTPRKHKY